MFFYGRQSDLGERDLVFFSFFFKWNYASFFKIQNSSILITKHRLCKFALCEDSGFRFIPHPSTSPFNFVTNVDDSFERYEFLCSGEYIYGRTRRLSGTHFYSDTKHEAWKQEHRWTRKDSRKKKRPLR